MGGGGEREWESVRERENKCESKISQCASYFKDSWKRNNWWLSPPHLQVSTKGMNCNNIYPTSTVCLYLSQLHFLLISNHAPFPHILSYETCKLWDRTYIAIVVFAPSFLRSLLPQQEVHVLTLALTANSWILQNVWSTCKKGEYKGTTIKPIYYKFTATAHADRVRPFIRIIL